MKLVYKSKKIILFHVFVSFWFFATSQQQFDNRLPDNVFIRNMLEEHVQFLSSEKLMGRSSITGHDSLASIYIDSIFTAFRLSPINNGSLRPNYQPYSITCTTPLKKELTFLSKDYKYGADFIGLGNDNVISNSFEVVFGGQGNFEYLDTLDIEGKALLVLTNNLRVGGLQIQEHARSKGCSLIILANPRNPSQFEAIASQYNGNQQKPYYEVANVKSKSITRYFARFGEPIPEIIISNDVAKAILGEASQDVLKRLEQGKNGKNIPSDVKVTLTYDFRIDTINTQNVIGIIPSSVGSKESVIVCAHFDHLAPDDFTWYPGADDNASGTSAILEVARLFAHDTKMGYQPKRNIIFAAFSAEEIGLLGSHYFTNNMLFPIDSIVIMLNLDMVGKMGKQEQKGNNLFVVGRNRIENFYSLKNGLNNDTTLVIDHRSLEKYSIFSLSDHYHFEKKGLPAFLLTTGLHADYHKPTDTPEKLDYDMMAKIVRLTYKTLRHFADEKAPWEFGID